MVVCICIGMVATTGFHLLVREGTEETEAFEQNSIKMEEKKKEEAAPSREVKSVTYWLKLPSLYLVALTYMATRLFLNLCQSYIPFYIQDSLQEVTGRS